MDTNALLVKKLDTIAKVPERSSANAAGYDLSSVSRVEINSGGRALVKTGIAMRVPEGTYGRIAPRSGLACKCGIDVGAGVIDRDYTGEVMVLLFNHGHLPFIVQPGDRIAQLILEVIETPVVTLVEELPATERSDGGFGSTGK